MRSLAIGPVTSQPSWEWVGADTAIELKKYYKVVTFTIKEVPSADIIIFIKHCPTHEIILTLRAAGSKLVYAPIDFFKDECHLAENQWSLEQCDLIITHAQSLAAHLSRFAKVKYLDHHGKFFLSCLSPYKHAGFCLWIGAVQNIPYLLKYLGKNPLQLEVVALSNIENMRARRRATEVSRKIGISMCFEGGRVNGIRVEPWSVGLQAEMLSEAKAAIDIKGEDFNQVHKPPTKAQKYICSGVPLAMNDCETSRYFLEHGLSVPLPVDARWLSEEYHSEVVKIANQLRPTLTLEAIVLLLKSFIDQALVRTDAE